MGWLSPLETYTIQLLHLSIWVELSFRVLLNSNPVETQKVNKTAVPLPEMPGTMPTVCLR